MRKGGEMLAGMEFNVGGRPKTGSATEPVSPTLESVGLDKKASHLWQKVSSAPGELFEQYLAGDDELTLAGLFRSARAATYRRERRWERGLGVKETYAASLCSQPLSVSSKRISPC